TIVDAQAIQNALLKRLALLLALVGQSPTFVSVTEAAPEHALLLSPLYPPACESLLSVVPSPETSGQLRFRQVARQLAFEHFLRESSSPAIDRRAFYLRYLLENSEEEISSAGVLHLAERFSLSEGQ